MDHVGLAGLIRITFWPLHFIPRISTLLLPSIWVPDFRFISEIYHITLIRDEPTMAWAVDREEDLLQDDELWGFLERPLPATVLLEIVDEYLDSSSIPEKREESEIVAVANLDTRLNSSGEASWKAEYDLLFPLDSELCQKLPSPLLQKLTANSWLHTTG